LKNQKKIKSLLVEQLIFLLYYKETLVVTSHELETLSKRINLLKEFDYSFPEEAPHGLPPLNGIKY